MVSRIKKFGNFIYEDLLSDITAKANGEYEGLKKNISELVVKTIKSEDMSELTKFIDSFIRDSEKNKIDGLVNDSDFHNFYRDNRNDIDELLSKIKFFEKSPSDMDCVSVYDYVVKCTESAVKEILTIIKDDIGNLV